MIRIVVTIALFATLASAQKATKVDFDKMPAGKAPEGFTIAMTSDGGEPKWVVEEEKDKGMVLVQVSNDKTKGRYPLCVLDAVSAKDVAVTVEFKAISGEVDQAAGIVVRYMDKDNYYIVRANSLEDNVRLYTVAKGVRKQIGGKDLEVPKDKWHTLGLSVVGNKLTVTLNGQEIITKEDDTFAAAGKVGLWTKADSVTRFDNLSIEAK